MNRAQDDITDYRPEWRALAWEAQQILDETRAYNRAQALRLANLGALENRQHLPHEQRVDEIVERLCDVWSDEIESDLAAVMRNETRHV